MNILTQIGSEIMEKVLRNKISEFWSSIYHSICLFRLLTYSTRSLRCFARSTHSLKLFIRL